MSRTRFAARAFVLAAALAGARASAGTVVSLNFDDNTATHRIAQRLLDERGMKGSFYVNTQYVGTSGFYLSRADLASLAAGGHEIAGHTLTHQILTNVSAAEARRQACGDRATLQSWGFNPVSFAYPNGNWNSAVIDIVRSCGYSNARTVGGVGARAETLPPANMFAIRTPPLVLQQTTLAQLQKYVTDAEGSGGGLIPFVFHRVCNGCGSDTITEANLRAFLDWLGPRAANGTVVRTMAQALGAPPPPPPPPAPAIASLAPSSATAGAPSFMLRVNGSGFTSASTVRWNGASRITAYSSPVRLDASIAAADVSAAGTFAVTVADPNGISNAVSFTVTAASAPPPPPPPPPPSTGTGNPVPTIGALSPASWPAGGSAFNLTVDGSDYVAGASLRFNGATRTGVLQGTTRLIVYIPASDVVVPATAAVTVVNPGPGGGPSNALPFHVTGSASAGGPNPVPSISALSPSSRPPGGSAFNLTVDGAGFASGASVRWNGLNRPGTLQGSSRLIVYIPPSDVAAAGAAEVRVFNPAPGGGLSNALTFTIGTSSAGTVSPAADPSFSFREHYAFPSPSRRGQPVTIRVRAGLADSVEVRVFDLAGRLVKSGLASAPRIVDDYYSQDFTWDLAGAGSGIYLYTVLVKKHGHADVRASGRFGVIK